MPETFFIADTHFGHEEIIRYAERPFANAHEMDERIIENWTSAVGEEDSVFVLGDFSLRDKEQTAGILNRLSGRKILICGNHDTQPYEYYLECGFSEVSRYPVIYGEFWILSHEPVYLNTSMPYANIFGHVHTNPIYPTVTGQSFCVSAERTGYAPVSFSEIKRQIADSRECSGRGKEQRGKLQE